MILYEINSNKPWFLLTDFKYPPDTLALQGQAKIMAVRPGHMNKTDHSMTTTSNPMTTDHKPGDRGVATGHCSHPSGFTSFSGTNDPCNKVLGADNCEVLYPKK